MPIDFQQDDRRRLITITLSEPFAFDEVLGYVDQQWADNLWDYAVLYDARLNEYVVPINDLQRLVDRVQVTGHGRARGPVGVAVPPRPPMVQRGLQFAARLPRQSSVEVLLNQTQIDDWVARNAPRR